MTKALKMFVGLMQFQLCCDLRSDPPSKNIESKMVFKCLTIRIITRGCARNSVWIFFLLGMTGLIFLSLWNWYSIFIYILNFLWNLADNVIKLARCRYLPSTHGDFDFEKFWLWTAAFCQSKISNERKWNSLLSWHFWRKRSILNYRVNILIWMEFSHERWDAFKSGKVLASSPRSNHAAALFGSDDKNYLFKDSSQGLKTPCILYENYIRQDKQSIGSYEKDLRAKIFRRKFFEKLFYKLSEMLKNWNYSPTLRSLFYKISRK